MKKPAMFGIFVGVMIAVQWAFFLAAGAVPELETEPRAIAFHIAAEAMLALTLVAGGWGVLRGAGWGQAVLLAALGMLAYSAVNSAGYFAELGQWVFVGMFALILLGVGWAFRAVGRGLRQAGRVETLSG
jgi:hypothetical protein